jgi:hypothetical protein
LHGACPGMHLDFLRRHQMNKKKCALEFMKRAIASPKEGIISPNCLT